MGLVRRPAASLGTLSVKGKTKIEGILFLLHFFFRFPSSVVHFCSPFFSSSSCVARLLSCWQPLPQHALASPRARRRRRRRRAQQQQQRWRRRPRNARGVGCRLRRPPHLRRPNQILHLPSPMTATVGSVSLSHSATGSPRPAPTPGSRRTPSWWATLTCMTR